MRDFITITETNDDGSTFSLKYRPINFNEIGLTLKTQIRHRKDRTEHTIVTVEKFPLIENGFRVLVFDINGRPKTINNLDLLHYWEGLNGSVIGVPI